MADVMHEVAVGREHLKVIPFAGKKVVAAC